MTAPFTDLAALATHLRNLAAAHSPIVLDNSILASDTVSGIVTAFMLSDGATLTVNGVAPSDVPDPAGNQLTISAGTAAVLRKDAVPITLTFSISGDSLEVIVSASMPSGWSFSDSFAGMAIFPFTDLTITNPRFVFSTVEQPSYPWPTDGSTHIDLAAGQNFLSEVGLGGFSLIATLLGADIGKLAFKLHGPFAPTPGQQLPVCTLTAPLGASTFSIGSAPTSISLGSPEVTVQIGTADDDTRPIQDVTLLVQGVFQNTLKVSVAIPVAGKSYSVSTTPLPSQSSITNLIESLPGGRGFTSYIPSELNSLFSAIGLDYFTMVVDSTPAVTYLGLAISTLQPWPVIPDVLELEGLLLNIEVVEPAGLDWTRVRIDAQAKFLPYIFTEAFDFTVDLEKQTCWEVSTVSGSYFGAVKLGDIVAGLLGSYASVPEVLRDISFGNFGVSATRQTPNDPFSYTCYGSVDAAVPILGSELTARLNLVFSKTPTSCSIQLAGALAIGQESFALALDLGTADSLLSASWTSTGSPLKFSDIASALGWTDVPTIPPDLDLALTGASFSYDFTAGSLVLTAQSSVDSQQASAALVAGKNAAQTDWGFLFGMVVGLDLQVDLTDIPLVGNLVPAGEDTLALKNLRMIAATTVLPVYTATDELKAILGGVVNSGLVLTADLQVGSAQMESFSVRLGGSNNGNSSSASSHGAPAAALAPASGGAPTTAQPGPQATWVNVQRAFGPVQINRVGFTMTTHSQVAILLDAGVTLGGLGIGLTGLEAEMPLKAPFIPSFDLAGLQVQFHAATFSIVGGLTKVPDRTPIEYTGVLSLTMGSFGATAFGSYTTVGGQPSLFAFVFVDVPLGGPAFCFVTGMAGGFGYNRSLQLPTISSVALYPLVQGAMGTLNADQTQTQLETFIHSTQNEDWFAAGVRFTSFEMVKSFALITVAFGTNVEIALMGESTLTIPVSTVETPQDPVAEADLLVLVDVQVTNGVVAVNAQLSSSSYVFSRAAQLTGGFAFYVWFNPSPYAGDFVVTLGGYNRYFQPPSYYPQVPLLGLNWQISSELTVKGGLYFALTPSAIMAGGGLSATWHSGWIKAWFDAQADFLIRFKPFTYLIDISISIGVSVRINLWVTSFTVTVHVGVDLTLWGPPFGGVAKIDLWIVSFTLSFGSNAPPSGGNIHWKEFRDSFLPPAKNARATGQPRALAARAMSVVQDASPTPTNSVIAITAPAGIVSTFTNEQNETVWSVSAGALQLVIGTQVPSTAATVSPATTIQSGVPWVTQLGVGPMGAGPGTLASTLAITIDRDDSVDDDDWTASALLGNVPSGLWSNTTNQMQTHGTVANALVGVTLVPAPPGGESTLPVPIQELLADDPPVRSYAWSTATVPRGDGFDQSRAMAQLGTTLVDVGVAGARTAILSALRQQGLSTAAEVNLARFAANAPDLLAAAPTLRYLGEVPKA